MGGHAGGGRGENGKGSVLVWDTMQAEDGLENGLLRPATELEFKEGGASVLAINPRFNMFASGDKEVMLWLPDPEKD
jgi:COMPASS component SWD2